MVPRSTTWLRSRFMTQGSRSPSRPIPAHIHPLVSGSQALVPCIELACMRAAAPASSTQLDCLLHRRHRYMQHRPPRPSARSRCCDQAAELQAASGCRTWNGQGGQGRTGAQTCAHRLVPLEKSVPLSPVHPLLPRVSPGSRRPGHSGPTSPILTSPVGSSISLTPNMAGARSGGWAAT
jgi:hypothetical protein